MHLILNNVSESNDLFLTMLRVHSHSAQNLIQAFCHLQACLMQQHPLWHICQSPAVNPKTHSLFLISVCLSVSLSVFVFFCFFNTLPSKLPVGFQSTKGHRSVTYLSLKNCSSQLLPHSVAYFISLFTLTLCFRADVLSHTEEQKSSSLSLSSFNKCHLFGEAGNFSLSPSLTCQHFTEYLKLNKNVRLYGTDLHFCGTFPHQQ